MRWSCEFHPVNGLLVAPAVISYEYPVPKPAVMDTTRGTSTIWGHLIKAGGDSDPKAIIRLRNGKLFAARVTKELIDEIQDQKLIYKDIGLKGVAVWNLEDWSMESFKAASIAAYRPDQITPSQSFEELAKASRGRWEGVDPVKFVNGLRTEEE